MQLGGAGGLLLTTLMARWDGQAGMPGGDLRNSNEFRAARMAAEAASAQIVLGTLLHKFPYFPLIIDFLRQAG